MKFQKGLTAGVAIMTLASVLAACGSSSSSSSKTTWTRMASDVLATMDPSTNTDVIGGQQLVDTMEGLYRYHGKKLQNALATSTKVTNGGKTYTFKLRHSKWSNGKPVTAKDFVYGWKRTVDPKTKSEYAYLYSGVQNADQIMAGKKKASTLGVKADGDYTLVVTLEHAIPYFKTMMVNPVFFPQSKTQVDKSGKKYGTDAKDILTNGPYTLKSWNGTGNTWTESKNKNYWNAKNVHIQNIKTQVVKDPSTAKNLYSQGKLDDAVLSGQTAAAAKTNKDYKAQKQSSTFYLELNEKKVSAFKNTKIRQALSMALNRSEYAKKVLNDGSIVAPNVTPEGLAADPSNGKDFSDEAAKNVKSYTKYNPTQAKKLFAEGLKETGKSSLSVELLTDDTTAAKQSAEYIQNALENVGNFKVTISTVPFKTRLSRSQNGNFDMVITGWSADFPDPITFLNLFTSKNQYNDGKWDNAQYDSLINKSKTTDALNPDQRWKTLLQAQELITKEQGVVPIYQRVESHLTSKNAKGITYSPAGNYNYVGASLK